MSTLLTLSDPKADTRPRILPRIYEALLLEGVDAAGPDEAYSSLLAKIDDFLMNADPAVALASLDAERMSLSPADLLAGAVPEAELRSRGIVPLSDGRVFEASHSVVLPWGESPEDGGGEFVSHDAIMRLRPAYYED